MPQPAGPLRLGFAITQHCNLRCPHCIRDDVSTVRSLPPPLIASVVDQALELFGDVLVGMTGGEPLLHSEFGGIVDALAERRVPYRFVSNGWHFARALPLLERWPPLLVRFSLSGASADIHDAERGRGSFRRVLQAVAMATSRRIPVHLTLVVDRRDRHQLAEAAQMAEALGVNALEVILAQPVPASVARNTDLPLADWPLVRREVEALALLPGRRTQVLLAYGAPFDGDELLCEPKQFRQLSVDAAGRLVTCCQLSDYGANSAEVVADLNVVTLADALTGFAARMGKLHAATLRRGDPADPIDPFPCMRCARASGKLEWLHQHPASEWGRALAGPGRRTGAALPVLRSA